MPEFLVAPRGLITILLFFKIIPELQSDAFQPGILLLTILVSSILMTYGLVQNKQEPVATDTEAKGDAPSETTEPAIEKAPAAREPDLALEQTNPESDG